MMHNSVEKEVSFYKKIINTFLDTVFNATEINHQMRLNMYMLTNQLVEFVSMLTIL